MISSYLRKALIMIGRTIYSLLVQTCCCAAWTRCFLSLLDKENELINNPIEPASLRALAFKKNLRGAPPLTTDQPPLILSCANQPFMLIASKQQWRHLPVPINIDVSNLKFRPQASRVFCNQGEGQLWSGGIPARAAPNFGFSKCVCVNHKWVYSTRSSQTVPHSSTVLARRCLTSVIGRERVYSSWYGCKHCQVVLTKYWNVSYVEVNDAKPSMSCSLSNHLEEKVYGTRSSQAVPHPSTILARRCLTSVIGRERVYSPWYGRRRL